MKNWTIATSRANYRLESIISKRLEGLFWQTFLPIATEVVLLYSNARVASSE